MKRYFKLTVTLLLLLPILIVVVMLLFAEWAWGGYLKTELDTSSVPTAEFLSENPISIPDFMSVYPPPGSIVESTEILRVYVQVKPEVLAVSPDELTYWTHLYINNQRLSRADYGISFIGGLSSQVPGYEISHLEFNLPSLRPGLNMIRIEIGTSWRVLIDPDEIVYSYTWAYRVR